MSEDKLAEWREWARDALLYSRVPCPVESHRRGWVWDLSDAQLMHELDKAIRWR